MAAQLPTVPRRLVLTEAPKTGVTPEDIAGPYKWLGQALGRIGQGVEDIASPFVEQEAQKAVTVGPDGMPQVTMMPIIGGGRLAKQWNKTAEHNYDTAMTAKINADIGKLQQDFQGDPAGFDQAFTTYKAGIMANVAPHLRQGYDSYFVRLHTERHGHMVKEKMARDEALGEDGRLVERQRLGNEIELVGAADGLETEGMRKRFEELDKIYAKTLADPRNRISPERLKNERDAFLSRATRAWLIGKTQRTLESDGPAAARKVFEEGIAQLRKGMRGGATAVDPARYETKLTPAEEEKFKTWKEQNAPYDSGEDYDLRGAFKAGTTADQYGHWPDTFKKPNHPTFSTDSKYAKDRPELAGKWEYGPQGEETYIPAEEDLNQTGVYGFKLRDLKTLERDGRTIFREHDNKFKAERFELKKEYDLLKKTRGRAGLTEEDIKEYTDKANAIGHWQVLEDLKVENASRLTRPVDAARPLKERIQIRQGTAPVDGAGTTPTAPGQPAAPAAPGTKPTPTMPPAAPPGSDPQTEEVLRQGGAPGGTPAAPAAPGTAPAPTAGAAPAAAPAAAPGGVITRIEAKDFIPGQTIVPREWIRGPVLTAESGGRWHIGKFKGGIYQFVPSTWMYMIEKYRPDLMQGRTEAQVLALRNPHPGWSEDQALALQEFMAFKYADNSAATLSRYGIPITPATIYAAHFLGAGGSSKTPGLGAVALYNSPPQTPSRTFVSAKGYAANTTIFDANPTAAHLIAWAERKGAGGGGAAGRGPGGGGAAPAVGAAGLPTRGAGGGGYGGRFPEGVPADVPAGGAGGGGGEVAVEGGVAAPVAAPGTTDLTTTRLGIRRMRDAELQLKDDLNGMMTSLRSSIQAEELPDRSRIEGLRELVNAVGDPKQREEAEHIIAGVEYGEKFSDGTPAERSQMQAQVRQDMAAERDNDRRAFLEKMDRIFKATDKAITDGYKDNPYKADRVWNKGPKIEPINWDDPAQTARVTDEKIARQAVIRQDQDMGAFSILEPHEANAFANWASKASPKQITAQFQNLGKQTDEMLNATIHNPVIAQTLRSLMSTTDPAKHQAVMSGLDALYTRLPAETMKLLGEDNAHTLSTWRTTASFYDEKGYADWIKQKQNEDPAQTKRREYLERKGLEDAYKETPDKIAEQFGASGFLPSLVEGITRNAPQVPSDPNVARALAVDYAHAYSIQFAANNGDAKKAKESAIKLLKEGKIWMPSPTNNNQLMKHAPEKYYPPVAGGHGYIRAELLDFTAKKMGVPLGDFTGDPMGTSPAANYTVALVPDKRTESEAGSYNPTRDPDTRKTVPNAEGIQEPNPDYNHPPTYLVIVRDDRTSPPKYDAIRGTRFWADPTLPKKAAAEEERLGIIRGQAAAAPQPMRVPPPLIENPMMPGSGPVVSPSLGPDANIDELRAQDRGALYDEFGKPFVEAGGRVGERLGPPLQRAGEAAAGAVVRGLGAAGQLLTSGGSRATGGRKKKD